MKIWKLGTRTSPLALWQAEFVKKKLAYAGIHSELVGIKTTGDLDLSKPIHQLGPTGVFTKALDDALLSREIDLAVHSLKDYPTQPDDSLVLAAVLERDYFRDTFIPSSTFTEADLNSPQVIATGSPRRQAQWLNKYPSHSCVNLRGNIDTRIRKIQENAGGIMSEAGLKRLGLWPEGAFNLDWMVPAPAQGVVAIVCRKQDEALRKILSEINHRNTWIAVTVERNYMAEIEAGCAAPLGAHVSIEGPELTFTSVLLSTDGKKKVSVHHVSHVNEFEELGKKFGAETLAKGGKEIMAELRASSDK